jgi:hypothetical protein
VVRIRALTTATAVCELPLLPVPGVMVVTAGDGEMKALAEFRSNI